MGEKTNIGESRYRCDGCLVDSDKRKTLKTMAGLALVMGAGLRPVSANEGGPQKGDLLVPVEGDGATPLSSADLQTGEKQVICYPYDPVNMKVRDDSPLNQILVIKLDPAEMDKPTAERAADGVLAYSAVCTHQMCPVNAWFPNEYALTCFCHFSKFDVLNMGEVIDGPAPRPLPAIPLMLDSDGKLVIAGAFTEPPGGSDPA